MKDVLILMGYNLTHVISLKFFCFLVVTTEKETL